MAIKAENRAITAYYRYKSLSDIGRSERLSGPWKVIVFCIVTILVPILFLVAPLYIRYEYYKDVTYHLGESDLVTVDKPISTFWCEGQDLWMNATFHAYLLDEQPKISEDLQHFEMDKHMKLADDTLEYWGFFLLQGSKVTLSVCSRFDGARLMVVKGTKNLKHCALLDPDPNEDIVDPWEEDVSAQKGEKIEVTFEQGEHKMVRGGGHKLVPMKRNATTTAAPKTTTEKSAVKSNAGEEINKSNKPEMPKASSDMKETEVDPQPSPDPNTMSSKKKPRFRVRGRKPVSVVEIEEPEPEPKNSTQNVRTIHENIRVQRHKSHPGQTHPRRTRRIVTTSDQQVYDDDILPRGDSLGDHRTSEEHDLPPNPVGVEPEKIQLVNQAQADLSMDKGIHDHNEDEVIDEDDIRSSGSSFAKNLWTCYGGDVIFTQSFSPSQRCQSQDAMMKHALRTKTVHEITSTGYYYYIFYSDNDIIMNQLFGRFSIEKVVYNFPNYTNSCLNKTQCSLDLTFLSSEKVLLEVPLQDGVSDEDALAQMVLVSTCRPRLGVYFIFPVAILVFIVCCAFM